MYIRLDDEVLNPRSVEFRCDDDGVSVYAVAEGYADRLLAGPFRSFDAAMQWAYGNLKDVAPPAEQPDIDVIFSWRGVTSDAYILIVRETVSRCVTVIIGYAANMRTYRKAQTINADSDTLSPGRATDRIVTVLRDMSPAGVFPEHVIAHANSAIYKYQKQHAAATGAGRVLS